MLEIDLTYSHSYQVEELTELPGNGTWDVPLFYIPRPKTRPEHDGLWLRMRPVAKEPWVGVFAFGYQSPPAISRVVSTPDPGRACIISSGAAYVVKADEPSNCEQLPISPVLDVRSIFEYQMLVFADFTSLVAYSSSGLAWRSPRVCWDELKILKVTHATIEGVGYDPINSGESPFAVDIKTGRSLLPSPVTTDGSPPW